MLAPLPPRAPLRRQPPAPAPPAAEVQPEIGAAADCGGAGGVNGVVGGSPGNAGATSSVISDSFLSPLLPQVVGVLLCTPADARGSEPSVRRHGGGGGGFGEGASTPEGGTGDGSGGSLPFGGFVVSPAAAADALPAPQTQEAPQQGSQPADLSPTAGVVGSPAPPGGPASRSLMFPGDQCSPVSPFLFAAGLAPSPSPPPAEQEPSTAAAAEPGAAAAAAGPDTDKEALPRAAAPPQAAAAAAAAPCPPRSRSLALELFGPAADGERSSPLSGSFGWTSGGSNSGPGGLAPPSVGDGSGSVGGTGSGSGGARGLPSISTSGTPEGGGARRRSWSPVDGPSAPLLGDGVGALTATAAAAGSGGDGGGAKGRLLVTVAEGHQEARDGAAEVVVDGSPPMESADVNEALQSAAMFLWQGGDE